MHRQNKRTDPKAGSREEEKQTTPCSTNATPRYSSRLQLLHLSLRHPPERQPTTPVSPRASEALKQIRTAVWAGETRLLGPAFHQITSVPIVGGVCAGELWDVEMKLVKIQVFIWKKQDSNRRGGDPDGGCSRWRLPVLYLGHISRSRGSVLGKDSPKRRRRFDVEQKIRAKTDWVLGLREELYRRSLDSFEDQAATCNVHIFIFVALWGFRIRFPNLHQLLDRFPPFKAAVDSYNCCSRAISYFTALCRWNRGLFWTPSLFVCSKTL